MSKPQLAVRIPPELLEELNSYTKKTHTSKTDVVVSAIAQYLGCTENAPLIQRMAELELKVAELKYLVSTVSHTAGANGYQVSVNAKAFAYSEDVL